MRAMMTGVANKFKGGVSSGPTFESFNAFGFSTNKSINCGNGVVDSTSMATTPYTYMTWFKTSSSASQVLIGQTDGGAVSMLLNVNQLASVVGTPSKVNIGYFAGGWTNQFLSSTTDVIDGELYHVAATYDGAGTVEIYVNGSIEGTKTLAITPPNGSASPLMISPSSGFFDGNITQTMVLNRKALAAEILDIYNIGKPLFYNLIDTNITDDAIMSYAMSSDDNSLTDESTGGNNGTAVNGVTSDGDLVEWQTGL